MHRRYSCAILLSLFISATSFSQIWLVRNVSNVFPDDCYVSFGNKVGIAYCLPERYVEPEQIDDWNDSALVYVLYPVFQLPINKESDGEKKNKRKKSRKKSAASEITKDSSLVHEAPKWNFTRADSLVIFENGKIVYTYENILVYKTYKPLLETDITSYRPFQLIKPTTTVKLKSSDY